MEIRAAQQTEADNGSQATRRQPSSKQIVVILETRVAHSCSKTNANTDVNMIARNTIAAIKVK